MSDCSTNALKTLGYLPCRCGSKAQVCYVKYLNDIKPSYWKVWCGSCGNQTISPDRDDALRAWNRWAACNE